MEGTVPCRVGSVAAREPVPRFGATEPRPPDTASLRAGSVRSRWGCIPPPHTAHSREGLRASGRHLAPITGPRRALPVPGCGAAAECGQCGMERSRLRSHEKLPPPAFRQDRGRGNGHARWTSARSCSRFNELCFNKRDWG